MRARAGWYSTVAAVAAISQHHALAAVGGDSVTRWNANAGVAATKACIAPVDDPFHESRIYAMMHIAIHDALNAIDRRFKPYTFDKKADTRNVTGCRSGGSGTRCSGSAHQATTT